MNDVPEIGIWVGVAVTVIFTVAILLILQLRNKEPWE